MNDAKVIHKFYKILKDTVWHSFKEVGLDQPYFRWYYAEDRLYIIHDVMLDNYWIIKAESPVAAMNQCQKRMEETSHSGAYLPECDN